MTIYYNLDKYFAFYNTQTNSYEEVFDSLEHIASITEANDVLLLPEENFIFSNEYCSHYSSTPFTIQQFRSFQEKSIYNNKKRNKSIGQILECSAKKILINGEPDEFILGKTGNIQFHLQCIYSNTYSELSIDTLLHKKITILPGSFWTLQQLNIQFPTEDYYILYIQKNFSKIIKIKDGFYSSTQSINRGSRNLKTMYEEQHIPKVYRDPSKVNPVTESITKETSSFFSQQIIHRIKDILPTGSKTIVISDLTKNHFVMDTLKELYNKDIGGFIIPFASANKESNIPCDIENYLKLLKQ
jgi:hypothetical protein